MADPNAAEAKPKLVAVDEAAAQTKPDTAPPKPAPRAAPPAPAASPGGAPKRGVPRALFWVVVALLVLSLWGLWTTSGQVAAQAARIEALDAQVLGLQSQLAASNTRVQTYEMQMSLVRQEVGKMLENLTLLHELVQTDPLSPGPLQEPLGDALSDEAPTL